MKEVIGLKKEKKPGTKSKHLTHRQVFVFEILIHVLILILILSVFFFTVITETERSALNSEVRNVMVESIDSTSWTPNPALSEQLITASRFFQGPSQSDENYNNGLAYSCAALLTGLAIGAICVWLDTKMVIKKDMNVVGIIYRNILLFGVVGCIEYMFFIEIASKYVPVVPSYAQSILKKDLAS